MRHLLFLFSSLLVLGLSPVLAQDMITTRNVTLIDDAKPSLTADKKDKLTMTITGRAFQGSVFLMPRTALKVISRQSYTTRESVGVTAKQVNRNFNVGIVEVLDGDHKGTKGWVVFDVKDEGGRSDVYVAPGKAAVASTSAAGADSSSSVDLVVSVGAGHISPTGGRLYEIGVVNKGGITCKENFEVEVMINGKVVKTERLRGPLNPNQVASFTLPVGDSDLRKAVSIKATVDPKNAIKEANETNNTATATARP